jgi:beta-N-acetylhexosaminidase
MRILLAKARLGLATKRLVNLEAIATTVNSPKSNAVAQSIADRSVTLVRNENHLLPLKPDATTAYFLLKESPNSMEGEEFSRELRKRAVAANVTVLDPSVSDPDLQAAVQRASDAARYVVVSFASVAAYRGTVMLTGSWPHFIETLTATKKPVALVAMGNPYLLRNFPDVAAYMTTYTTVPPAEISTVKALFGEIPITGKLPVTIPGFAKYGDGISLP